jgi:hypothetical protein
MDTKLLRRDVERLHLIDAENVPEHRGVCHVRQCFLEELEALGSELRLLQEQPRDVASRPSEARNVALRERVVVDGHDDGGNGGRGLPCGSRRCFWPAEQHEVDL